MRHAILTLFSIAAVLLSSCSDDVGVSIPEEKGVYSVSGNVQINNNRTIPDNARVIAVWSVSSGSPDKAFVYGSGKINKANNTFNVNFPSDVPDKALNRGNFGIGFIMVTTNQTMKDGDEILEDSFNESEILGVVVENAAIYIKGDPAAVTWRTWAEKFKTGFNLGQAVWKDQGFDEYEPKSSTSPVILIIDDLKNLKLPNWT